MKWAGGYVPPTINLEPTTWSEHRQVWELRRQVREQQVQAPRTKMPEQQYDDATLNHLLQAARIAVKRPDAAQVIADVPEVVAWLRSQMTATGKGLDDAPTSGGKPGSKPPFRIAFMNAADREVATLAYWADEFGIRVPRGLWRVRGATAGVFASNVQAVDRLASEVAAAVRAFGDPDGIYDHPRWGVWVVRSQHFANWPALASVFASETVESVEDSNEQLELL